MKALLKLTAKLNGFNVINLASGKSIKLKIINFLKKTYNIKIMKLDIIRVSLQWFHLERSGEED